MLKICNGTFNQVVEENEDLEKIEEIIDCGQVEELIDQAEEELTVIPFMNEHKPWYTFLSLLSSLFPHRNS